MTTLVIFTQGIQYRHAFYEHWTIEMPNVSNVQQGMLCVLLPRGSFHYKTANSHYLIFDNFGLIVSLEIFV